MTVEPWTIGWFVCTADPDDVKHAKTEGRTIKVGHELWRVAVSIGPIANEHNHWAGYHLTGEPAEVVMASLSPVMADFVRRRAEAGDAEATQIVKLLDTPPS